MKQKGGNGIGVVVAAYNAAAWLVRCLDSVLAAADVDAADVCIVVADDGSTDGTAAIAQRYAETDGRVQLLKLTHGGQAAARAAAIAALPAQVDRVMIVDADDTIPQQSLSQMAARLSPDIVMVIANVAKYTARLVQQLDGVFDKGLVLGMTYPGRIYGASVIFGEGRELLVDHRLVAVACLYSRRDRPPPCQDLGLQNYKKIPLPMLRLGSFLFYPNGVNLILPKGVNHARLFHTSQNEIQFN